MPRPLFTPGKDPVPIVQEAGWAPGPVWTRAENLATTGIRSPDRPVRSESLYRLSYRTHNINVVLATTKNIVFEILTVHLMSKKKLYCNFFIITNLVHKFLVHSHKLH